MVIAVFFYHAAGYSNLGHILHVFCSKQLKKMNQISTRWRGMCRAVTKPPLMSICPPLRDNKRYMFVVRKSPAYSNGSPVTIFFRKMVRCVEMCSCTHGPAGMIKTDENHVFGPSNLQYHADNVWAVTKSSLMSTIPPNMLSKWYMFGSHRPRMFE